MRPMRPAALGVALLLAGCLPRFDAAECYGPGECGPGFACIARACLPSADGALDAGRATDAAPAPRAPLTLAHDPFGDSDTIAPLPDSPAGPWTPLTAAIAAEGALLLGGSSLPPGDGPSTGWLTRLDPAGRPDARFGDGGWFAVGGNERHDGIAGLAVDAGGDLIVSATASEPGRSAWWIHRLTADGRPVTDFADDGRWRMPTFPDRLDSESSGPVVLDGNGRIVAAGIAWRSVNGAVVWDVALARLTSDGVADPAFGQGGQAVRSTAGALLSPTRILPGPRRGWTLLGLCDARPPRLCAWRVEADGRPDVTFGVGGDLRLPSPGMRSDGVGAVDDAGRLWVTAADPAALARLTDDGDPDPRFGDGGWAPLDGDRVMAVTAACGGVLVLVRGGPDERTLRAGFVADGADDAEPVAVPMALADIYWMLVEAPAPGTIVLVGADRDGQSRLARLSVLCDERFGGRR